MCRNRLYFFGSAIFVLLVTAAFADGGAGAGGPRDGTILVDRIVAIVNDDIIRLKELEAALSPIEEEVSASDYSAAETRRILEQKRKEVLNLLINRKLADQVIESEGISVSGEEIEAAIERVKSMNQYTDADLRRSLRMSGMDMETYRKEIRRQILQSKLVNRMVKSSIVITEEDIREYYRAHPEKYQGRPQYRLKNIFMECPADAPDDKRDAIRRKMQEAMSRLEEGQSFESVARLYSEGANAQEGGELGSFHLQDLKKEIRPIIRALAPGETSGMIETQQGFQIFHLTDIVKPPDKPLEAVSDEIRKRLYDQAVDEKFQEWIEGLRKDAHIKIIS